jgi:hypothetical protein
MTTRLLAPLLLALAATGCATGGMQPEEKLALYEANAGAPVDSFKYFGSINGWTPLGDSAIALWTRPREAWLLDFHGPCHDVAYSPVITVTNSMGRVSAKFDKVIARNRGSIEIPCTIRQIRPLDVSAIRAAEKTARDQPEGGSTGT